MELRNEYSKWLGFADQLVNLDDSFPLPINHWQERSSWPQARHNRFPLALRAHPRKAIGYFR